MSNTVHGPSHHAPKAPSGASDIIDGGWVDRLAPTVVRPYLHLMRLDRPIGAWLLLLPCWWGVALASRGAPDVVVLALFAVGAVVMRGAGCTMNDIADRNFDGKVARTATRPIPSGAVSVFQAGVFLALLCLLGLVVLVQFNAFAIALGASSLGLVAIYPFMKRVTYWPQFFLGLAFNWGALLGWAVERASLGVAPLVLYAAGIFWTLGYDTIYAHQDKEDDILIGIKSTALRLGKATGRWLIGFYAMTIGLIGVAGYFAGLGWLFYVGLVAAALHLAWQVATLDTDAPKNCLRRFKSNRDFGLIVFAAIVAGRMFS
ncbi:4-hydroxybenzoate octaprenyltransferase [Varunaivibrio sulfuroxidans]|uniref:4-hydroxybenzoate octaprenyltransferase n=1 Tax=Varunaivibrio sulfuroxidans TaxID=1773489 RepID=A0A4R3J5U4_9PROT|nr:4-hydroxybenzoate octaprenyltransferase [Varunaivibrio sulfuroxidans]TCS60644.1 4-hydroxybenzoate polyprenyltransferase [Varunaivibrio sulfuroxidans]WES30133.1 4-hydroxybenzoate octaprenyltransferase [Varunaivibrio sulfuroxidans]